MRFYRLCSISIFLLLTLSVSTTAQEQAKEKPTPKIAFIDTSVFSDEKDGILIYAKTIKEVESELAPLQRELEKIAEKIREIEAKFPAGSEESDKLRRVAKYKLEDYKIQFEKRASEVLKPIEESINNELTKFATQKGLTTLLDVGGDIPICVICPSCPDITKEFIAYYNAKHPVTNSQTQPSH